MGSFKKHKLRYALVKVSYEQDEEIRKIADEKRIPYIMAKEEHFEKQKGLRKWVR